MDGARRRPVRIVDHDAGWAVAFAAVGVALGDRLDQAAVRIDHIGSTAVPGLAAKDVIDIQVTVAHLDVARGWPYEILPDLMRRPAVTVDHLPLGLPADTEQWAKLYWSNGSSLHLHVREEGRLNQRYPILFRDYLRADPVAAGAYGLLKRSLAEVALDDSDILRGKRPGVRPDSCGRRALGRTDGLAAGSKRRVAGGLGQWRLSRHVGDTAPWATDRATSACAIGCTTRTTWARDDGGMAPELAT